MSPSGSISRLFEGVRAQDSAAEQALWTRSCDQLVRLARKKLGHMPRRMADEEDIANRAFESLLLGARRGRFPDVTDRESLWRILVFITAQKVADQIAYERRKKRGGGKVRGHSALVNMDANGLEGGFDKFPGKSPGPQSLNQWAEEYDRLLACLKDDKVRRIAELRVQGHTIDEIAEQLHVARATIRRKLQIIRDEWLPEKRK